MSQPEKDDAGVEHCEEIFCEDSADVSLINHHTGKSHVYCLSHAEEALDKISQLNVGESL